jgi:hypothetical protein
MNRFWTYVCGVLFLYVGVIIIDLNFGRNTPFDDIRGYRQRVYELKMNIAWNKLSQSSPCVHCRSMREIEMQQDDLVRTIRRNDNNLMFFTHKLAGLEKEFPRIQQIARVYDSFRDILTGFVWVFYIFATGKVVVFAVSKYKTGVVVSQYFGSHCPDQKAIGKTAAAA